MERRKMAACVSSVCSAMLPSRHLIRSNGNDAPRKSLTTAEGHFQAGSIEVPKNWSPLATKIAVSKYFYGDIANGTDPYKGGRETSVRQLIHRVTRTLTDCGIADSYFADAEAAETFYDELTWLCLNQHGAFNSPVWFNVGLYHQYGVGKGAGAGNYFYNRETGKRNAQLRNMSTRRAAPASSRTWVTRWRTSCAWRPAKRCCSSTAAAPARIFRRSDRHGKN
jgi:Class II vitamin B12-dependent ribonucleotide reductase.